jgi:hypothetical protein
MPSLRVQIVRFVDDEPQPGIVESQFCDAHGKVHSIIDKVPMFTSAALWSGSEYPQIGFIECSVMSEDWVHPQTLPDPIAGSSCGDSPHCSADALPINKLTGLALT